MSLPPANWYPDPTAPGTERYWDGNAWGATTRATPTPQAAAGPMFAPQAPAPQMFPPPAPADMVFAPKRSRKGLWITLGAVGLLVVGLGVTGAIILAGKVAPISGDYTGAPVTSSDVASAGSKSVISSSETVAVEIPSAWRDVQEYVDVQSAVGTLPSGASLLGAWFTMDPTAAGPLPQMIMVLEITPLAAGPGTMDDIRDQYLSGLEGSTPGLVIGASQDYKTALGLEGDRTDMTLSIPEQNLSGTMAIVAVAHERRFVLVVWTAYEGAIDEQDLSTFMTTLRVDP